MMRAASERGSLVLGLGDFNVIPGSLCHRIVEGHSTVRDLWQLAKGTKPAARVPSAKNALEIDGSTCDSVLNTWRWSKKHQKDLRRGKDRIVDLDTPDPLARRLDYIFFSPGRGHDWAVDSIEVGMTMRHPELRCSVSDHFAVEASISRQPRQSEKALRIPSTPTLLRPAGFSATASKCRIDLLQSTCVKQRLCTICESSMLADVRAKQ